MVIMKMNETAMVKILKLLYRESPLSPMQIADKLNMPSSTVRSTLTMLKSMGFVRYFTGTMHYDPTKGRSFYELTEEGRKRVEELEES